MSLANNTYLQQGKYRILSLLGQGGFGITYLAEQVCLNRKVAIKEFFIDEYCQREGESTFVETITGYSSQIVDIYKAKFIKEAKIISKLDHPNIVRIHDIFEENNTAYIVMEYLRGGDLLERIPENGMDEVQALKIIRQVCGALKYIHAQDILHLDIKPKNILFRDSETAVLIDFGISKHYSKTDSGETSSTPAGVSNGYAPLEQYDAVGLKLFSPATDIYSLGATLFHMLTGSRPPSAAHILNNGVPQLPDNVSSHIVNVVNKAMACSVKQRIKDVNEFTSLLDNRQIHKRKTIRQNYKKKVRAYVGIAIVVVALIGIIAIVTSQNTGYVKALDDGKEIVHEIITEAEEIPGNKPYIDLNHAPEGVYAVDMNGMGVKIEDADEECIAVALVEKVNSGTQRFWIEKYQKYDSKFDSFYWQTNGCEDLYLPNYTFVNENDRYGYLPKNDDGFSIYYKNPYIPAAPDEWYKGGALNDFKGRWNSDCIIQNLKGERSIGSVRKAFNESTENFGKRDWYIPSCGQLALIFLNMQEINKALEKIGGKQLTGNGYWSSTEYNKDMAWYIGFQNGPVSGYEKSGKFRVRLIRDIR